MPRVLPYLGTALAAALAATTVSAVASTRHHGTASHKPHRNSNVIWVIEHPDSDQQIDIGATGDSPGDQLPFGNPIFDKTNTKQVGTDQGNCIRIQKGVSFECMWTTFLKGGQITVEGPFLDSGAPTKLAITGGTGRYSNAGGWMLLRPNAKNPNNFDFVFHIQKRS
jgi:hypothetical protein